MAEFVTHDIPLGKERSLHLAEAGRGVDVVLVHGAFETSHDWIEGPFTALAEEARLLAVDRPGHGRSRRPRFAGTPRDQARQIKEGLDRIGVKRALLVGHSYGALVALAYAEQFPEAVTQLVLAAPIAFPEPRLLEHSLLAPRAIPLLGPFFSQIADATIDRGMLELAQKLMFSPDAVPARWKATFPYDLVLDPQAMVFEGEDMSAILPLAPSGMIRVAEIRTPTHILTGTLDKIIEDERQAKQLARLMPNARLTEVSGVGHMLHHSRPDLIVDAVCEALASA